MTNVCSLERCIHKRQQTGSAMVEYSVITLMTVMVLFVPLPGFDESLLNTLLLALKQFQANTTYLMSLP